MKQYQPLIVLLVIAALSGLAIMQLTLGGLMGWMHGFMGVALIIFSMLKLFDPEKFAEGFAKYDLLAMNWRGYALTYPFIELGLGLAYLSYWNPEITYIVTIAVFGVGAVGVVLALKKGLNLKCACMGTVLNVPLSHVTLTEDLLMIAMAGYMLAMG
jgi:hypothetical protein